MKTARSYVNPAPILITAARKLQRVDNWILRRHNSCTFRVSIALEVGSHGQLPVLNLQVCGHALLAYFGSATARRARQERVARFFGHWVRDGNGCALPALALAARQIGCSTSQQGHQMTFLLPRNLELSIAFKGNKPTGRLPIPRHTRRRPVQKTQSVYLTVCLTV